MIAVVAACSSPTPTIRGPIATPGGTAGPLVTTPTSATGTQQSQTPSTPAAGAQLTVENRGGETFNVTIGGTVVATLACGQVVVIVPGANNVPALPWDLAVVRVSDNSTLIASRLASLPRWIVQKSGFEPNLYTSEPPGTPAPCAS
jgi:hypothetical protein